MTRKLFLLNLLLVAAIVFCGWQLRERWRAAREKEQQLRAQAIRPAPAPPLTPLTPPPPASPTSYVDVAQRMLFSKDRNPNIEVIVTPPKPMPPLPAVKGVLLFADPPAVIMTEKAGAPERSYRPGQTIGEFKLVAVNDREIEFEWDGQRVKRSLREMIEAGQKLPPAAAAEAQQAAAPPPPAAPAAQSLATPLGTQKAGPGAELGGSTRACVPGDTSPAGTVVDGYRKVVSETPFGKRCHWEPVR